VVKESSVRPFKRLILLEEIDPFKSRRFRKLALELSLVLIGSGLEGLYNLATHEFHVESLFEISLIVVDELSLLFPVEILFLPLFTRGFLRLWSDVVTTSDWRPLLIYLGSYKLLN